MSASSPDAGGGAASSRRLILTSLKLLLASLLLLFAADAFFLSDRAAPRPSTSVRLLAFFGPLSPATLPSPSSSHNTTAADVDWISVPSQPTFTSSLLAAIGRWRSVGADPCRDARTTAISIPALDGAGSPVSLSAGGIHDFLIRTLDESGRPRCLGGDYFETDLSGESWKSRPPVADHGNGTYSFKLQVHPDFAGDYNLTVVLLFRSFEGLKFVPARFKYRRELRKIPIRFAKSNLTLPHLQICRRSDFSRNGWSGRWTRLARNDSCQIDRDGRFRCLPPDLPCAPPWCGGGPLAALESNGWVYSAHCSFRVFTQEAAWGCLSSKWLFFWGDSNHVDTIRNLLTFVLGVADASPVRRRFDAEFKNPGNASESVRITSIFNGHWNETKNYLGLESLSNDGFRRLLWEYFLEERAPDAMVLNSGLHDGVNYRSIKRFAEGAEYAGEFWRDVMEHYRRRGRGEPRVVYRTTIATGGYARDLAFNPSKMDAFNGVMVEKLREKGVIGGVVDEFDMTFPWHYDNRCNDGVHYGRAPANARWRDGEVGHQYFVDLMLAHVLLNAICSD